MCAMLGLAPVTIFHLYRRDIRTRNLGENALRESERRYRLLTEYSPNAIGVHEGGRLVYTNPAWVKLLGAHSVQEIAGTQFLEFFHPDSQAEMKRLFASLHRADDEIHELRLMRRDRTPIDLEVSAVPLLQDGRETVQIIIRDVTERKRAQEEMAKALQLAQRATQLKSEFLAHMSHELRTPMNGVVGMADVLLSTPLSAEQREYTEVIRSSAGTLMALLNHVLDLARVEAGKVQLESAPIDLRTMVNEVAKTFSTRAQSKHLKFTVTVGENVPSSVWGDEIRLRQVLTNLADNAIKFTEHGGISIRLKCLGSVNGLSKLYCAIEDTGIGIPLDKQELIFDNFEQADSTSTRRYGGSGLGLSICQRFIHLMGGEIGVNSAPHGGSRFWFTVDLPVAGEAEPELYWPVETLVQ
jgi:PAS domain S-box-containing protein